MSEKKALSDAVAGMYIPPPPPVYVAMWGGEPEDYMPEIEVWECIADSFAFYGRIDSQWRCGPGGIIGLDYNVIPMMAEIYGVEVNQYLMQDIAVMEAAALKEIHKG